MKTVKTLDDYFRDWEAHVFGYGYGSGEEYVLPCLRRFLELCGEGPWGNHYDYIQLEKELSGPVAWFLINTLCHCGIVDYGVSPRYGSLTEMGKRLKKYMLSKEPGELVKLVCNGPDANEGYAHCTPTVCNCGPDGYAAGLVCQNPFWLNL